MQLLLNVLLKLDIYILFTERPSDQVQFLSFDIISDNYGMTVVWKLVETYVVSNINLRQYFNHFVRNIFIWKIELWLSHYPGFCTVQKCCYQIVFRFKLIGLDFIDVSESSKFNKIISDY